MSKDEVYMQMALDQAQLAETFVAPNPMVGAVIVLKDKVIAKAHHGFYGDKHAEIKALEQINLKDAAESTLYLNLEPCCHHGKQPPCLDTVLKVGFKRIVIASMDPNPKVSGQSILTLQNSDTEVLVGVLEDTDKHLNRKFYKWITNEMPFITLKIARTLDGKIATKDFKSKFITGPDARADVHNLRSKNRAILIGSRTLKLDNPNLGLHGVAGNDPFRILLSASGFEVSSKFDFFRDDRFFIASSINEALDFCSENNLSSLLVEGGSDVFTSFIKKSLYDEIELFIAHKVLGNEHLPAFSNLGLNILSKAIELKLCKEKSYPKCTRLTFST